MRGVLSQREAAGTPFDALQNASLHGLLAARQTTAAPVPGRGKVVVEYGALEPWWLREAADRLGHLLTLEKNWDSYGAAPVSEVAVRDALVFLHDLMPMAGQAPFIAPLANGGLQVEWAENDAEVGFIVAPDDGTTAYAYSDVAHEEWDLTGPQSVSRLIRAMRALTEH